MSCSAYFSAGSCPAVQGEFSECHVQHASLQGHAQHYQYKYYLAILWGGLAYEWSTSGHAELFFCRVMPSNANLYIYRTDVKHHLERASLQGHAQECQYDCLAVYEKVGILVRAQILIRLLLDRAWIVGMYMYRCASPCPECEHVSV